MRINFVKGNHTTLQNAQFIYITLEENQDKEIETLALERTTR